MTFGMTIALMVKDGLDDRIGVISIEARYRRWECALKAPLLLRLIQYEEIVLYPILAQRVQIQTRE